MDTDTKRAMKIVTYLYRITDEDAEKLMREYYEIIKGSKINHEPRVIAENFVQWLKLTKNVELHKKIGSL